MAGKKDPINRSPSEILVGHLPFLSLFLIKGDITIFKITEKNYDNFQIRAHVYNHPRLVIRLPFDELVHTLDSNDVSVIKLLLTRYNH